MPLVLLRDRDHEPEVRVDHQLLRLAVAALDPLRELDLLLGGQELVAADLVEEQLQRVGGRVGEIAVHVRRVGRRPSAVVRELDPAFLDVLVQALHVVLVEPCFLDCARDLRELEAPLSLAEIHQRGHVLVSHLRGKYHHGVVEKRATPYCAGPWPT